MRYSARFAPSSSRARAWSEARSAWFCAWLHIQPVGRARIIIGAQHRTHRRAQRQPPDTPHAIDADAHQAITFG